MGYRIDYGVPSPKKRGRATVFLAVLLAAAMLWPRGREVLQDALFGSSWQTTSRAASCFAQELRRGDDWKTALEAFFRRCLETTDAPG